MRTSGDHLHHDRVRNCTPIARQSADDSRIWALSIRVGTESSETATSPPSRARQTVLARERREYDVVVDIVMRRVVEAPVARDEAQRRHLRPLVHLIHWKLTFRDVPRVVHHE